MIQQITAYVPKTDVSQPSQPKASENEADSFQSALSKAKVATSSKENATKKESAGQQEEPAAEAKPGDVLAALMMNQMQSALQIISDPEAIDGNTDTSMQGLLTAIQGLTDSASQTQQVLPGLSQQIMNPAQTTLPQQKTDAAFVIPNFSAVGQGEQIASADLSSEAVKNLAADAAALQNAIQSALPVESLQQTAAFSKISEKDAATLQNKGVTTSAELPNFSVADVAISAQMQANHGAQTTGQDASSAFTGKQTELTDSVQGELSGLPITQQNLFFSAMQNVNAAPKAQGTTMTHLTEQIAKNYQAGNNQFKMDLFPNNLGKVSVSMKVEQGFLVVDILADNPKTQSLLASSSGDIRSLLETAVGQPVQIAQSAQENLQYQQQDQDTSGQEHSQQQKHQQQREESTEDFLSVLQQLKEQTSIL